jgi:hypothetical protein
MSWDGRPESVRDRRLGRLGFGPDSVLRSLTMGPLLTKRRAVDLCRVATCLCCLP